MTIRLELLTGNHERNLFDCGVEPLNTWLRQTALQHQGRGISRTFVALPADAEAAHWAQHGVHAGSILGFYALASALVLTGDVPAKLGKRFPRQIPVTRLGRLAVRVGCRGKVWGNCFWRMPSAAPVQRRNRWAAPGCLWTPRMKTPPAFISATGSLLQQWSR